MGVLLAAALVVAGCAVLVVAGCGEPSVPTSASAKTAASLGTSEWPVLGESGPVLGVDLYALNNYSAAEVEADGERTLAYIKNVLKADVVGIVWNFYAPNPYADPVGATECYAICRQCGHPDQNRRPGSPAGGIPTAGPGAQ